MVTQVDGMESSGAGTQGFCEFLLVYLLGEALLLLVVLDQLDGDAGLLG